MIAFVTAGILMLIIPGPGVISAAAVGAGCGLRDGIRYLVGLWAGNFSVSIIVVSGLWSLLATSPGLRVVLSVCSLAYFTYLAWKIATANRELAFGRMQSTPNFVDGFVLQILNPKAYAANAFLFTNFVIYSGDWALEVAVKIGVSNVIWLVMHVAWFQLGVAVKKLNLQSATQRKINIAMAVLMMVAVVLAAIGL